MTQETVVISRAEYEELQSLKQENARLAQALLNLQEQIRLANEQRFGRKSEQSKYDDGSEQLTMDLLFNEVEAISDIAPTPAEPDLSIVKAHKRKKHATNDEKLPEDAEIEIVTMELPAEERLCPECGDEMREIGEEVTRKLKIVPAKIVVVETHRKTYACANCEKNNIMTPIKTAPGGSGFLPGSMCLPEAVAYIMVQKYMMYSPLYRLEQEFERMGIELTRQTMSSWLIRATDRYLKPVYNLLKENLLKEDILHADETTLQVLHEPGREAKQKSYMWLYRAGRAAKHPIMIYEYQETRKAEHPKNFLNGYAGYLHTDGYAGYHALPPEIAVVGCWAHARRKFDEALKVITPNDRASSKAMKGKRYCDALFALEDKLNERTPQERAEKRKDLAEPILTEFRGWLQSVHPAPKSVMGRAVAYALEQWPYLTNYLKDGRLELSNNRAERSVKPFVMGRKNFLFANTPGGAKTSAIIYSLIETAKESGLDPYRYLTWLMTTAPSLDLKDFVHVSSLLPQNAPDICGMGRI